MPEGRILLKAISESRKLSQLKSDGARLLYTWLIPHCDIRGCFSGEADIVLGKIFTRLKKTPEQVEEYLQDLCRVKLITRWSHNGDKFIQLPDFEKKQPYLNPSREAKPKIKLPSEITELQSNSGPDPGEVETRSPLSKIESKIESKELHSNLLAKEQPEEKPLDKSEGPSKQNLLDHLKEVMDQLRPIYPNLRDQRMIMLFIEAHIHKAHPDALLHCIRSLLKSPEKVVALNTYLCAVLKIENGKYHARDSEKASQAFKEPLRKNELNRIGSILASTQQTLP